MFNLLVGLSPQERTAALQVSRIYRGDYSVDITVELLRKRVELPTVMMLEGAPHDGGLAHFVRLDNLIIRGRDVSFNVYPENGLKPFSADLIDTYQVTHGLSAQYDWHHTCWQYGEGNIFKTLYNHQVETRASNQPLVFSLKEPTVLNPVKVACMMPFALEFDDVYATIGQACDIVGKTSVRVDEVYGNRAIINDVVEAIDTASVVICDLTGKNPNVLYETGIAHAIGREVIILAQDIASDVPFDLKHLRCIQYNGQNQAGRDALKDRLSATLAAITN